MSSFPSTCKTLHVPPSSREHTCCDPVGVILSQGGCVTHDHGQMLGPELGLSDIEYTHLQHLIQANIAPPYLPDARSHPAAVIVKDATGSTVISPITTTQAIDLSTSTDDHCLMMPGEKTPASYGEVPGFVLARVKGEDSPSEPRAHSSTCSQMGSRSAARVCLEKRFNTMSADTPRQQDIQSAVLSNSQPIKAASATSDSAGESGSSSRKRARPHMTLIQRRERHNSKERERRKRIRAYFDELKMLVPFCESDSDKVTTLQWTTAFLRYINKTHGDTFKEEFHKAFIDGKRHFLKSNPSSGQDPIHREMDKSSPRVVEQ